MRATLLLRTSKHHHELLTHMRCGDLGSAYTEGMQFAHEVVLKVLSVLEITRAYSGWNSDETGCRRLVAPYKTIADMQPEGYEKALDPITLLLVCNATGTVRRPRLILSG